MSKVFIVLNVRDDTESKYPSIVFLSVYRIALGLCDYFHSENPVCRIIKPRASGRCFDFDSYQLH